MHILVLNSGSSSIKFALFDQKTLNQTCSGMIEAIGLKNCNLEFHNKKNYSEKASAKNHQQALKIIFEKLIQQNIIKNLNEIKTVGHRVVHGGNIFQKATIIDHKNLSQLKKLSEVAPLHNPHNLNGIIYCLKNLPKAQQVAIFDTAFHSTIPVHNFTYAIPQNIALKYHIRKYGFHGTNHQYISEEAQKILKQKKLSTKKIITVHIGNGISVTAIENGKSIDTSMGFTPLPGPLMGTRSGNIDPAVPLILCEKLKKSPAEISNILNKESGLMAISKISSDFRPVYQAATKDKNPHAQLAIAMLAQQIACQISSYLATLNGVDAIVFSGGIGQNAWYFRNMILNHLKFLEIKLNTRANTKNEALVTFPTSKVQILAIPANEELAIARQTRALL